MGKPSKRGVLIAAVLTVLIAVACSESKDDGGGAPVDAAVGGVDASCTTCADGAVADVGTDGSRPTLMIDAAACVMPDAGDDGGGVPVCPSLVTVNPTDLPWKPPTPLQAGKCTNDDLTAMADFLAANTSATNEQFLQFVKARSADCHACILTDGNAATWGPIPQVGGKLVTLNIGACFALVSGVEECGRAVQAEFDCEFLVCESCNDDTAFSVCRKKAMTGACKCYVDYIAVACQGVPPSVDDACGTYLDSVRVQCVQ